MRVRDFKPEDYDRMVLREGQDNDRATAERVKAQAGLGPCWTLENSVGEVVASGGIVTFDGKVGEMWLVCGVLVDNHKKSVVKAVRSFITLQAAGFHRLHFAVMEKNSRSLRFAQVLGFHEEGVMEKFDTMGNDYIMMARIR